MLHIQRVIFYRLSREITWELVDHDRYKGHNRTGEVLVVLGNFWSAAWPLNSPSCMSGSSPWTSTHNPFRTLRTM